MNTTTILAQKQRLRNPEMNLRVPDITQYPSKYHPLFHSIGKSPFIKCFKAVTHAFGHTLTLTLRDGEQPNIIVMQRVMVLFKGLKGCEFNHASKSQEIIVNIPV